MTSAHIIFVDRLLPGKGVHRASGILLGKAPGHASELHPQWSSWILSDPQREISCQSYPRVVGHGADLATGEGVIFFDGEPVRSSSVIESILGIAANRIAFYVNEGLTKNNFPIFIASDPFIKPCRFSVRVRLKFSTLNELPDIQAWAAYGDWIHETTESSFNLFERLLFAGFIRTPATFGKEFLSRAQSIIPKSGNRFPIQIHYAHKDIYGVLILHKKKERDTFYATLHMSASIAGLSEGTILYREVEWTQKTKRGWRRTHEIKRFYKEIGTVEAVLDTGNYS